MKEFQHTRQGGRHRAKKRPDTARYQAQSKLVLKNLSGLQVHGRVLAAFRSDFVGDFLTFVQRAQASAFNSADVNKNVGTAVVRLDKAEAFLRVEPFNCTLSHIGLHLENALSCMKPLQLLHEPYIRDLRCLRESLDRPSKPCGIGNSSPHARRSIDQIAIIKLRNCRNRRNLRAILARTPLNVAAGMFCCVSAAVRQIIAMPPLT